MTGKDIFKGTIIVLATLVGAYVLMMSLRILVVVVIAIIVASAVRPMVLRLMRWRFSEGLDIITVYLVLLLGIFTLTALVIPPIINSLTTNLQNEDRLANRIIFVENWVSSTVYSITNSTIPLPDPETIRTGVSKALNTISPAIPSLLGDASSTIGEAILVFVMGVYWLTSHQRAVDFIIQLFTIRARERAESVIYEIENMMGSYVRGIVLVAIFIGTANFIVLAILRVPNAATLGFIIGIGTMLPIVGGFVGGGFATLLALLTGTPLQGLAVLATFVVVQQVETHYLTPRAMSRSVGLDPLLTIVAVLVGFTIGGVVGAIIATPIMGMIAVLLREIIIEPRKVTVSPYSMENGLILINQKETSVEVVMTPVADTNQPSQSNVQQTASGIILP